MMTTRGQRRCEDDDDARTTTTATPTSTTSSTSSMRATPPALSTTHLTHVIVRIHVTCLPTAASPTYSTRATLPASTTMHVTHVNVWPPRPPLRRGVPCLRRQRRTSPMPSSMSTSPASRRPASPTSSTRATLPASSTTHVTHHRCPRHRQSSIVAHVNDSCFMYAPASTSNCL